MQAADAALPMMYMPDCLDATWQLLAAPRDALQQSTYNVTAVSFTPDELAGAIRWAWGNQVGLGQCQTPQKLLSEPCGFTNRCCQLNNIPSAYSMMHVACQADSAVCWPVIIHSTRSCVHLFCPAGIVYPTSRFPTPLTSGMR